MIDTEDKRAWCVYGEEKERGFPGVSRLYGFECIKNPEKEHNKYANDLMVNGNMRADLKTVRTPYFTAWKYGFDPGHAVTLNVKDHARYMKLYAPAFWIIFWVSWPEQQAYGRHICERHGVWIASITRIDNLVTGGFAPRHEYQKRKDLPADDGNAKDSYLLDLRWLTEKKRRHNGSTRNDTG